MRRAAILLLAAWVLLVKSAAAHHLDNYDARIRGEANLPALWFECKTTADCELVSTPCQSDLAVNGGYSSVAREALVRTYFFCLGSSVHDTAASCEGRQCVTKSTTNQSVEP